MTINTRTINGKEAWQCHSCKRWFYVKTGKRVDALLILDKDSDENLQCMGCSGGYEAVTNYLAVMH